MNQNNEDRQLSVFEIDANDDETDVVFLEQAYAYHQQLVAEENRLPLTRNLINRGREGAEERLMADYFNDHCRYPFVESDILKDQKMAVFNWNEVYADPARNMQRTWIERVLQICYSGDKNSFALDSIPNFANDSPNVFHSPPQPSMNFYEFCGNDAYYSHDCPPQELAEYINIPSWNHPAFFCHDDDDEDYTIAITPEEPDNSLNQFEEFSDSNDDSTSIDDAYLSIDNIDYVEATTPDSELVSLEEVDDDNLREKLLNINLLIAKIKSLNGNPTFDHVLKPPS
uniref:Uncharacterized protein n=1 Tax=Tanacetum cinerariifolium TaxID=118510 RepID=A0A6L2M300_TANCI|nr:hypothetical protein [Tanacetum cinerariifolium]